MTLFVYDLALVKEYEEMFFVNDDTNGLTTSLLVESSDPRLTDGSLRLSRASARGYVRMSSLTPLPKGAWRPRLSAISFSPQAFGIRIRARNSHVLSRVLSSYMQLLFVWRRLSHRTRGAVGISRPVGSSSPDQSES